MEAYLIVSDSYKLVKKQVEKITGNSLNVIKYDLKINTINEVINEANYFSLLNEQKYIIIHSDSLFKSQKKDDKKEEANADIKLIENYFNKPNDKCTLIFISYEYPDKRKKIYKLFLDNGQVINIDQLNKKELTYKCMELLKEKKYEIDYETANFIVDNSYTNYDIMTNELEKIFTLIKPKRLTIKELQDVVSKSITNTTYDFINAIINRDLKKAINSSENFERLKVEPAMIIVMLAKEYQIMHLLKNGIAKRDIQNIYHKEDWQMKNYLLNTEKYTKKEKKKAIIKLADYDYKYKSGLLDKSVILELLSLDFCD